MRRQRKDRAAEIRKAYRQALGRRLSDEQIERARRHMRLLAQAICEHVWGKKAF